MWVFFLVRPAYISCSIPETIKKEPLHLTYVTPQKKGKKRKTPFYPSSSFLHWCLGKKEQAEAPGPDPFTHLQWVRVSRSKSVVRKRSCLEEADGWLQKQHLPLWMEAALRHPTSNRAPQRWCLDLVWGCRTRHKSATPPSSFRTHEEVMKQWREKVKGCCIFIHVGSFACFTS